MNLKNRQNLLVVLTIATVVLAVAVNWVIPPIMDWWSGRQKQITDLRSMVQDGNRMIKREKFIRDRWQDMQANALPASTQEAEQQFLKALNGWSRESGAEITSIMPQWKNESTNYMTLDCRVESSGDLNSLSRFIYNIERGPTMVRLDTVELSSHDNNGQQMTMGLEIDGLALLQNGKK